MLRASRVVSFFLYTCISYNAWLRVVPLCGRYCYLICRSAPDGNTHGSGDSQRSRAAMVGSAKHLRQGSIAFMDSDIRPSYAVPRSLCYLRLWLRFLNLGLQLDDLPCGTTEEYQRQLVDCGDIQVWLRHTSVFFFSAFSPIVLSCVSILSLMESTEESKSTPQTE